MNNVPRSSSTPSTKNSTQIESSTNSTATSAAAPIAVPFPKSSSSISRRSTRSVSTYSISSQQTSRSNPAWRTLSISNNGQPQSAVSLVVAEPELESSRERRSELALTTASSGKGSFKRSRIPSLFMKRKSSKLQLQDTFEQDRGQDSTPDLTEENNHPTNEATIAPIPPTEAEETGMKAFPVTTGTRDLVEKRDDDNPMEPSDVSNRALTISTPTPPEEKNISNQIPQSQPTTDPDLTPKPSSSTTSWLSSFGRSKGKQAISHHTSAEPSPTRISEPPNLPIPTPVAAADVNTPTPSPSTIPIPSSNKSNTPRSPPPAKRSWLTSTSPSSPSPLHASTLPSDDSDDSEEKEEGVARSPRPRRHETVLSTASTTSFPSSIDEERVPSLARTPDEEYLPLTTTTTMEEGRGAVRARLNSLSAAPGGRGFSLAFPLLGRQKVRLEDVGLQDGGDGARGEGGGGDESDRSTGTVTLDSNRAESTPATSQWEGVVTGNENTNTNANTTNTTNITTTNITTTNITTTNTVDPPPARYSWWDYVGWGVTSIDASSGNNNNAKFGLGREEEGGKKHEHHGVQEQPASSEVNGDEGSTGVDGRKVEEAEPVRSTSTNKANNTTVSSSGSWFGWGSSSTTTAAVAVTRDNTSSIATDKPKPEPEPPAPLQDDRASPAAALATPVSSSPPPPPPDSESSSSESLSTSTSTSTPHRDDPVPVVSQPVPPSMLAATPSSESQVTIKPPPPPPMITSRPEKEKEKERKKPTASVFSSDTVGARSGSWFVPWTWGVGGGGGVSSLNGGGDGDAAGAGAGANTTTSTTLPGSTEGGGGSEVGQQTVTMTMTESEKIKEEALARQRQRELDDQKQKEEEEKEKEKRESEIREEAGRGRARGREEEEMAAAATTNENPIKSAISSRYSSGWSSIFGTVSRRNRMMIAGSGETEREREKVKRDENGVEVMDLDSDSDDTGGEGQGQGQGRKPVAKNKDVERVKATSGGGSRPLSVKSAPAETSAGSTKRGDDDDNDPKGKKKKTDRGKGAPPTITVSEDVKRESETLLSLTTPSSTSSPGNRSRKPSPTPSVRSAPAPTTTTANSSPTKKQNSVNTPPPPPPRPPNLVLPTWADTFHTAPRSVIPPSARRRRTESGGEGVIGRLGRVGKWLLGADGGASSSHTQTQGASGSGSGSTTKRRRSLSICAPPSSLQQQQQAPPPGTVPWDEWGKGLPRALDVMEGRGPPFEEPPLVRRLAGTPVVVEEKKGVGEGSANPAEQISRGIAGKGAGGSGKEGQSAEGHVRDVLRGCKNVVVIGIHGWFPGAVMRSVLGEPTGTSPKFVNMMVQALEEFQDVHNVKLEKITKIPLEGEGTIERRVEKLYNSLLSNKEWMKDLHNADAIFVATHSQGSVVSTHLLDRLIRDRHIRTAKNAAGTEALADLGVNMIPLEPQRVCCLALCGIHLGPLRYLSSSALVQPYIQYFESTAARELFDFQNTESEVSKAYVKALENVVYNGTKMVYVASMDDQVVPIYSGLFTSASHPLILRALYIDGDAYSSSDFLSNLLVLLLRVMNCGLPESGLLAHLSDVTAGTLSGVGHSTAYEELSNYALAVNYLFLTNDGLEEHPKLSVEPFNANAEQNDYEIPWALRDLIADERVAHFFSTEISQLRDAFQEWHPKTTVLKDVKRKLQPIQRLPSTFGSGSSTLITRNNAGSVSKL